MAATSEQAEPWRRMIGFRNVVVHDDLDVDRASVSDVLQRPLDDLRALLAVIHRARPQR